jgi:hypothetical protein
MRDERVKPSCLLKAQFRAVHSLQVKLRKRKTEQMPGKLVVAYARSELAFSYKLSLLI